MKKLLVAVGLILGCSINTYAQDVKTTDKKIPAGKKDDNGVFLIVETMPEFPSGEAEMMKFLVENVKYPGKAREKGIQGIVIVNFIVREDGTIENASVLRGVHALLDAEALRVIYEMPKWKPGTQDGEAVKVSYNIPFNFKLANNKKKKKNK